MTALRIAARPFTSPCSLCGQDIPEDLNTAVFALADNPRHTVCDQCGKRANRFGEAGLTDLRRIDARYWAIYNRRGGRETAQADAAAYLAAVVQGAAELMAMYLSSDEARDTLSRLAELAAESDASR